MVINNLLEKQWANLSAPLETVSHYQIGKRCRKNRSCLLIAIYDAIFPLIILHDIVDWLAVSVSGFRRMTQLI